MLSPMKRVINFSKPGFRRIQCSARFNDEVKYEGGRLTPIERPERPYPFFAGTYFHYEKWDLSLKGFKSLASKLVDKRERQDQIVDPKRLDILGPDLAAAHFFIFRRGIVRFKGIDKPFDRPNYRHLPNSRNNNYRIEAISLPDFNLYYEGLDHLRDLNHLKALSFHGVEKFDNWYLDRLSHLVPTLEYLDISYCKNVDANGLHCLYRMKNLKCLNVEGVSDSVEFRLACLTVESEKRDFVILGTIIPPKAKTAFE